MQNKTVFITGASSGIGKATALFFLEQNWNVIASMRNPDNCAEFAAFPNIFLVQLDVTKPETITKALDKAIARFGTIDCLVNNAGYGTLGSFESASEDQIKRQFETNVFGLMSVAREFIPHFRKNRSGVIINIASIAGQIGFPMFSIYNSSKFAVEGFSQALRYELIGFGIKVRLIEPGPIKTDFYSRSMDVFDAERMPEYKTLVQTVNARIIGMGSNAKGPEVVAKKIFKAATDKGNRLFYPVGGGAPAMLLAKKLLPDCLFRFIIRKALGVKL